MRVIVTAKEAGVENEKGLFLTEDEVVILKDVLDSVDEESLIDQEFQLVQEIRDITTK